MGLSATTGTVAGDWLVVMPAVARLATCWAGASLAIAIGTGLEAGAEGIRAVLAAADAEAGRGRREPRPVAGADIAVAVADLGLGRPLRVRACFDGDAGLLPKTADTGRCKRLAFDATDDGCDEEATLVAILADVEEAGALDTPTTGRDSAAAGRIADWPPILLVPVLAVRAAFEATLATLGATVVGCSLCFALT